MENEKEYDNDDNLVFVGEYLNYKKIFKTKNYILITIICFL